MIARKIFDRQEELFGAEFNWSPFPTIEDRKGWARLPEEMRVQIVALGDASLAGESGAAELGSGDEGGETQSVYFTRRRGLVNLLLGECVSDSGKHLRALVDGLETICRESSWALPEYSGAELAGGGVLEDERGGVDLFVAETAGLLALVLALVGERLREVSEGLTERVEAALEERFLDAALARDDYDWMGLEGGFRALDSQTPWIASNWLLAALLVDRSPARRLAGVYKAMGCLDRYMMQFPREGGFDKGPSYWSRGAGAVLDCFEILHSATKSGMDLFGEPLVAQLGERIAEARIDGGGFASEAERVERLGELGGVVYRYGVRSGDNDLMRLGAALEQCDKGEHRFRVSAGRSLYRVLLGMFDYRIQREVATTAPSYLEEAWLLS